MARRESRAHVDPPPIVSPAPSPAPSLGELVSRKVRRLERKRSQGSLWPDPDVRPDGRKTG